MKRWLGVLVGVGVAGGMLWGLWPAGLQVPKLDPVTIRQPSEEVSRCVECHAPQSEMFLETGHAQALRPGNDPDAVALFAGQTTLLGQPPVRFRLWKEYGHLWQRNEKSGLSTRVNWMFGSGHHGITPVVVAKNAKGQEEGPDLHVSWYRGHGLALTMGHEAVLAGDPNSLGSFNDVVDTQRCFHCHTTELTRKGQGIETAHLLPGVLCSKCHPQARQHAERMQASQEATGFDDWKSLTPLQSIERCGECHRSPTALKPEELHPNNRRITRFASVGLSLSHCFQLQHTRKRADGSAWRLDCLSCHEPHRPQPTDLQHYNRACRECHTRPQPMESDCPKQSIDSNCVSCHMPKVRMNAPVSFTDHWIRTRPSGDAPMR